MEPPDPASTLSDDDQLSLWVGRVARVHALLEYNLSNLHGALRPPGLPVVRSTLPASVDLLVDECRKLLETTELNPEIITAGTQALSAAKAANAERNRVVHDMWLPDPGSEAGKSPTWQAFRRLGRSRPYASSTLHNLDTVMSAHTNLVRSRLRVSGLFMALHEVLPWLSDARRPHSATTQLPRYIALMKDHFALEANGDYEIAETE